MIARSMLEELQVMCNNPSHYGQQASAAKCVYFREMDREIMSHLDAEEVFDFQSDRGRQLPIV